MVYYNQGHTLKALDYFGSALRAQEASGDKKGMSLSLNNISVIYSKYGNIQMALEYAGKGLKIREEIGDKAGIGNSLNSMGFFYFDQGDFEKGLEYYNRAIKIREEIGDKGGLGSSYVNMGYLYSKRGNQKKAVEYYEKSLKIREEVGDKNGVANTCIHLGSQHLLKREHDKALAYFERSMALSEEIKSKDGIAEACINLSALYYSKKNYKEALLYANKSLNLASELGYADKIRNAERWIFKTDSMTGDYKGAFEHFKQFVYFRDSINNEVTRKASVKSQFQTEFDKKERDVNLKAEAEKLLLEQKSNDERQQKNIILYSVLFGLAIVLVFSGFLVKSLSKNKKASVIISRQKAEVEQSKKEIVDSINYAKRIQYALLASDNLLNNNLPEHFVLFQPKDVVSGDFYWATPTPDGFIYITADCTGHGVPGAFMSLLNISKLSQAINENKITRPDLILNNVRSEITKALNPEGTLEESRDGMDAVLCKLNLKKMKLEYASAYNSFYILRNNEVLTCKADKMPVGKGHDDSLLFTYNEFALQKGDTIYTFTDGFADQFGGPKGKKFKYKQLESILLSIHHEPMHKQKEILLQKFTGWKGNLEQIDDMLVMGVKIT